MKIQSTHTTVSASSALVGPVRAPRCVRFTEDTKDDSDVRRPRPVPREEKNGLFRKLKFSFFPKTSRSRGKKLDLASMNYRELSARRNVIEKAEHLAKKVGKGEWPKDAAQSFVLLQRMMDICESHKPPVSTDRLFAAPFPTSVYGSFVSKWGAKLGLPSHPSRWDIFSSLVCHLKAPRQAEDEKMFAEGYSLFNWQILSFTRYLDDQWRLANREMLRRHRQLDKDPTNGRNRHVKTAK